MMIVIARDSSALVAASENPDISFEYYLPEGDSTLPGIFDPRRFTFPAGGGLPMHDHDAPAHEILMPLVGRFKVVCDNGESAIVGPGDWVISTPGQAHAVDNITDDVAEMVIVSTPCQGS